MRKRKGTVAVVLWSIVLGYFTCSLNPFAVHLSGFHFSVDARFSDLVIMDLHFLEFAWVFSKVGHFSGFFIMDVLLYRLLRKPNLAAVIAVVFGVSTEIFQLYFARDGRLYDMVIDSLGVTLSYYLLPCISRVQMFSRFINPIVPI